MPRQFHADTHADLPEDAGTRSTPAWVVRWLESVGARIWLDVCATRDNAQAPRFFSPADDGLAQDWGLFGDRQMALSRFGYVNRWYYTWMNPPYSRGQIALWLQKAIEENKSWGVQTIACLPADLSTQWARHLLLREPRYPHDTYILRWQTLFLIGRQRFQGLATGAMFPTMLVVIGSPLPGLSGIPGQAIVIDSRKLEAEHG